MRRAISAAILGCSILGAVSAWGAAGDFDQSFGTKGITRAPFAEESFGYALGRQGDGKLLVAGTVAGPSQLALLRFQSSGVLDATFGSGGIALAAIGFSPHTVAVLVQNDGRVVLVGELFASGPDSIFLVRYTAQGNLDSTFGTGGSVIMSSPGDGAVATAVLQPDGKVVVAWSGAGDVLVLRYQSDGTLDPGFAVGGIATIDFGGFADTPLALALEPDGRMTVAARSQPPVGNASVGLARLDGTGAFDATFGSGGTVVHDLGATPASMTRLSDGRLVVSAGKLMVRLDATGALDPTFGIGGAVTLPDYGISLLAVAPDGKLVGHTSTGYGNVVLQRFEPVFGSYDPTFGNEGQMETRLGLHGAGSASMMVEPDGAIVVTGVEFPPCTPMNCDDDYGIGYRLFLARFQGQVASCSSDADCGPCESCGWGGGCFFKPRTSCTGALTGGAKITIDDNPRTGNIDRYRIRVKWRGATPSAFDPLASDVGLCLYFEGNRVLRTLAPSGQSCAGRPCWTGQAGAFNYRDRERTPDGITKLKLKKSLATVDASGAYLAEAMHDRWSPGRPELLSQSSMVVQIHGGNGACLGATLSNFEYKLKPIGSGAQAYVRLRGVGQ